MYIVHRRIHRYADSPSRKEWAHVIVNRSIEQAVMVLLMLALQEGHRPVGSQTLSAAMGVSDSYLKKTLRKLVVAGLVVSCAGRDGGFCLARPIDHITLGDAYRALDPDGFVFRKSDLAHNVFEECDHLERSEGRIAEIFAEGYRAFEEKLDAQPLSGLLKEGAWENGALNW